MISKKPFYIALSNAYALLPDYAAAQPDNTSTSNNDNFNQTHANTQQKTNMQQQVPSTFKHKAYRKFLARQLKRQQLAEEEAVLDRHITWAEDERTEAAKLTQTKQSLAINRAHTITRKPVSILQNGRNAGYALATSIRRATQSLQAANHVRFLPTPNTRFFSIDDFPSVTYDSGADGHYLNEQDRTNAGLPILRTSSKRVAVANGAISKAKHESSLPFQGLSASARKADTFDNFPQSLMSVGKVSDDGNVSIFTKDGVTVHHEEDVLITCKGEPILIGVRDEHGRYRIPLTQTKHNWQPRKPSK